MKVKTKVKAGPRDCGGGGIGTKLPAGADIPQSDVQSARLGAPPRS